jgi:predicted GNAT family N-acyltransferase
MAADREPAFKLRITDWPTDAPKLRAVRMAVFVIEQRIPEDLEWDEHDPVSAHALAEGADGTPIGCGRLLPDGHIGRMAVLADWRGHGVGTALLETLLAIAGERGFERVRLHAQTRAMPFYARFGFAPVGNAFDEAGIPHQTMERWLRG